ncbi:MAG: glycosyltransferase [Actinobacteria bacterium]|nr:MAG: glycosyltransferase [Actinomycetota bacterium]
MNVSTAVKKIIRPLIPDRVMARVRLHQHSRLVRNNFDVFVEGPAVAKRWLASTPDTYRVRLGSVPVADVPYATMIRGGSELPVVLARPGAETEIATALGVLGAGVDVAVVAACRPPGLVGRRRAEPLLIPKAVAIAPATAGAVPGLADVQGSLEAVIARLRSAGATFGLVPRPLQAERPVPRGDRIVGDTWVVLAAVPMHDIGGGSRSAQLALELLRRGANVVYVSLYGSQESSDLGLRHIDPRLEQEGVIGFSVNGLISRCAAPGTVLVEAPAPELASVAIALGRAGWSIVYDVIDDWSDPALGGEWHVESVERDLVGRADAIVASAPDLVARVAAMGGHASLIPNGVNSAVFGGDEPAPSGLGGDAGPIIGYHGSLYGAWFDWQGLARVARAFPEMRLVVIGDDKGHPELPGNVEFLGLKPQGALPGYLQAMSVGLIPFLVTPATHGVSPLKAYEYLASGVPVAAPPLRALAGLDGVYLDDDLVAAVRAALRAPRPDRQQALLEHGWERRLDDLYRALGREPAPVVRRGALVVARPVAHHPRRQRLIRS